MYHDDKGYMRYFSVIDGRIVYFKGVQDAKNQNLNRSLFRKTKSGKIVQAKYRIKTLGGFRGKFT
jgi:hypothetical protein